MPICGLGNKPGCLGGGSGHNCRGFSLTTTDTLHVCAASLIQLYKNPVDGSMIVHLMPSASGIAEAASARGNACVRIVLVAARARRACCRDAKRSVPESLCRQRSNATPDRDARASHRFVAITVVGSVVQCNHAPMAASRAPAFPMQDADPPVRIALAGPQTASLSANPVRNLTTAGRTINFPHCKRKTWWQS